MPCVWTAAELRERQALLCLVLRFSDVRVARGIECLAGGWPPS